MVSIRYNVIYSITWVMIASLQVNIKFPTSQFSNISNNLLFDEKLLDVVTVSSTPVCSCVCSHTLRCDGYKFRIINKTCHTFSAAETSVSGEDNSKPKCAPCSSEETAENLIWKMMSRKEKTEKETEYLGCLVDGFIRILTDFKMKDNNMTQELCIRTCRTKGFKYAGTEHGKYCLCGNSPRKYAFKPETECNQPCSGNEKQKCGGFWRISLYKINL